MEESRMKNPANPLTREAIERATRPAIPAQSRGGPRDYLTSRDYRCSELAPFEGRPGSMDAFDLPSVVNGERIPHRRPAAQCVGALKDSVSSGRD